MTVGTVLIVGIAEDGQASFLIWRACEHEQQDAADGVHVGLLVVALPFTCLWCAPRVDACFPDDRFAFIQVVGYVEID